MQVNMTAQNNKGTSFEAIRLIKGDSSTIRKIHNKFLQATVEGISPEIFHSSSFEPKFKYSCVQLNPYQDHGEDVFVIATGKDADNLHSTILKAFNSKFSGRSLAQYIRNSFGLIQKPQEAKKMLQELEYSYDYREMIPNRQSKVGFIN